MPGLERIARPGFLFEGEKNETKAQTHKASFYSL
jgi:hypothetical protein